MSVFRSVLLLGAVTLLASAGLVFWGSKGSNSHSRLHGYAVLSVDASIEDRFLCELLDSRRGNFWNTPVSESTQWVMLDTFGSLETVPLDKFYERLASFDPRNDGYAQKLKDVFVRDGKRFIYLPLKGGNWNSPLMDKHLNELLGDVPFTIDYFEVGQPFMLFFIVYAAASIGFLVVCYAKRKSRNGIVSLILLIPVFSSLVFFGASGIACISLLFGLFFLLREPLKELTLNLRIFSKVSIAKKSIYKGIIKPYGSYLYFSPLFIAAFGLIVIFSELKFLFLFAVFAAALAVFLFSCKILSLLGGNHRRFTPVSIIKRRFSEFDFSVYMLPFAAAAFLALFFTLGLPWAPSVPAAYITDTKFDVIIEEQDYYAHLNFQTTFSTRSINTSFTAYPDFVFGEDGLPVPSGISKGQTVNIYDFPPFPLKYLMEFFNRVNNMERTNVTGRTTFRVTEVLSILVLLLFIIPGLFVKNKNNYSTKINISGIIKASGKKRLSLNRAGAHFLSGKNTELIRKDA